MQSNSVFKYQSARTYLKDTFSDRKRQDPDFSVRRFARQSEVGSHSLLVMVLNGKRRLTLKQAPAFARALDMSSLEHMYFKTLIQLDNATSDEERDLCKLWLNDLNPSPEHKILEIEQFQVISNWIHMAILTLAKIDGAKIMAENISQLVSGKVPVSECRTAIQRLLDLGLLAEREGQLRPTQDWVRTRDDVAQKGGREYHKQVMKLAIDAIEEQTPSEREYQSFAVTVPAGKLTFAKEMIRKFRHQFAVAMESEPGHEVYQCNLQFFRLTESPLAVAPAANEGAVINPEPMKEIKDESI